MLLASLLLLSSILLRIYEIRSHYNIFQYALYFISCCSIFKDQRRPHSDLVIIPHSLPFVNTFLKVFLKIFKFFLQNSVLTVRLVRGAPALAECLHIIPLSPPFVNTFFESFLDFCENHVFFVILTKKQAEIGHSQSFFCLFYHIFREHQISRLPSMARKSVISSAYSRSAPTGTPYARRVTFTPRGPKSLERYIAVASPSTVGLVAMITS